VPRAAPLGGARQAQIPGLRYLGTWYLGRHSGGAPDRLRYLGLGTWVPRYLERHSWGAPDRLRYLGLGT